MNTADAKRAAILCDAYADLDQFVKAARESKFDPRYKRHICHINFGSNDDSGMDTSCSLAIDFKTGLKLLPMIRKLINDELSALGVEP